MIIAYSTIPGFVSIYDHGTWYEMSTSSVRMAKVLVKLNKWKALIARYFALVIGIAIRQFVLGYYKIIARRNFHKHYKDVACLQVEMLELFEKIPSLLKNLITKGKVSIPPPTQNGFS